MERINAYLLISQEKKTTVTSDGLAECCVCDILHCSVFEKLKRIYFSSDNSGLIIRSILAEG